MPRVFGHVFVYGTLKRGFPNFKGRMEEFECLGAFRTSQPYPLVVGGLWNSPYLLPEPGVGFPVLGELFAVDQRGIKLLDELEGVGQPKGYHRIMIPVERAQEAVGGESEAEYPSTGEPVREAWVYMKERASIEGIHAGPMAHYAYDPDYVIPSNRPVAT